MSSVTSNVFDQHIAAIYPTKDKVKQAQSSLIKHLGLNRRQIQILEPASVEIGQGLKSQLKAENMLLMHIQWGALGLSIGMLLALLLVEFGPQMFANNPAFTYIGLISPSIFSGAILAGIRLLTSEQGSPAEPATKASFEAKSAFYWTLLVNTSNTNLSKKEVAEQIQRTSYIKIHK